jgi:hypothetical protein
MDPRAGLDDVEKRKFLTLPGLELRHLGRPARSQSLYRLRYSGYLPSKRNVLFIVMNTQRKESPETVVHQILTQEKYVIVLKLKRAVWTNHLQFSPRSHCTLRKLY